MSYTEKPYLFLFSVIVPESQDGGGWKFWRRFSTRARSERAINKADVRGRDRPEITLLEAPAEAEQVGQDVNVMLRVPVWT